MGSKMSQKSSRQEGRTGADPPRSVPEIRSLTILDGKFLECQLAQRRKKQEDLEVKASLGYLASKRHAPLPRKTRSISWLMQVP